MLLALIILQLSVLVAANPFHKYPFVFLLDVGNEELEKTNSEQIRLSVPGGSIALRYPAIGDGNTISHVRVSGIDFGTDLKSNIVDGGPGYKYVVLVFMGNPGVPYDAVLTVQTVDDSVLLGQNIGNVVNSEDLNEEDANNSAEDLSDSEEVNNNSQSEILQNSKAELMQSSSNVYRYADYQSMDEDKDEDDGDDEVNASNGDDEQTDDDSYSEEAGEESEDADGIESQKDLHSQYTDDIQQEDDSAVQVKGFDEDDDDSDENEISSKEEQYSSDDYPDAESKIDSDAYSKYERLKGHENLGGDYTKEYYQQNFKPVYQEDPLDYEESDAGRPVYDDEGNGIDKYRDSNNNNNNIDSDDSYAVAY